MATRYASAMVILPMALLGGCLFWPNVGLPTEIPPEVLAARSDPERFSPSDHPLADVTPGTVIDDLGSIAGCWGRYDVETHPDPSGHGSVEIRGIEVLVFDASNGTFTRHRYTVGDPWLESGQALLVSARGSYAVEDDSHYTAAITAAEAGAYADGEFACNVLTNIYGVTSLGDSAWAVTIDGDYMSRRLSVEGVEQGQFTAEDAGLATLLHVRIDCDLP